MYPRSHLRAEGIAVFAVATAAYFTLDGPLWLFLALALAPDLAMLGYLAGPRVGSTVYNLAHTYVGPLALLGVGLWLAVPLVVSVALVWGAHIGADRAVGYGLKYPTAFKDTHLGRLGAGTAQTTPAGTELADGETSD
jgi:hypothetical protein